MQLPNEVWREISTYLSYADRLTLLKINTGWVSFKHIIKVEIDEDMNDLDVQFLFEKCGSYLEEIISRHNLSYSYGGKLLGQICPKLKSFTFASSNSFVMESKSENMGNPVNSLLALQQLFSSFKQLERLEIFQPIKHWNNNDSGFLGAADILRGLASAPSVKELFIANWHGIWHENPLLANLQPLQALTLGFSNIETSLVDNICRLTSLRELNLQFKSRVHLNHSWVESICESLVNLECLVVANFGWTPTLSAAPQLFVSRLPKLKTFVFVAIMTRKSNGTVLLRRSFRHISLNVFIASEICHLFAVQSDNIRLSPIPNFRRGEAIQFLQQSKVDGFSLEDHSVLTSMARSNVFNGHLDFHLSDGDWTSYSDTEDVDVSM